jgi:hypothetical protein
LKGSLKILSWWPMRFRRLCIVRRPRLKHGAELVRRLLLHVRCHVLVQVGGDGRRAVTEALAHDLYRDAGFQQQGGGRVAGVVRPDHRQADLLHEPAEPLGHVVRMKVRAVGLGEHEVAVVVGPADELLLLVLARPVCSQHVTRRGVEGDDPSRLRGLR